MSLYEVYFAKNIANLVFKLDIKEVNMSWSVFTKRVNFFWEQCTGVLYVQCASSFHCGFGTQDEFREFEVCRIDCEAATEQEFVFEFCLFHWV